ncbi:hypothetical protein ACQ1PL_09075 [Ornithobacterium rhinotracheale]
MDYKEVKQKLKKEFTTLLKPKGFKSKADNQGCSFLSEKDKLILNFGYGVENYVDEFKTGIFGSICFKEIASVEKEALNQEGFTDTLLMQKRDYFQDINYRFVIKTDDDIAEWMKIVTDFYSKVAEPFYNKFSTVADIDILLNSDPSKRVPELNDLGAHIITGLISAKLNENPNYNELRTYYEQELESKFKGHFLYNNCKQVIDYLDTHSLEELNEIS